MLDDVERKLYRVWWEGYPEHYPTEDFSDVFLLTIEEKQKVERHLMVVLGCRVVDFDVELVEARTYSELEANLPKELEEETDKELEEIEVKPMPEGEKVERTSPTSIRGKKFNK
jgi:hypothetical protein